MTIFTDLVGCRHPIQLARCRASRRHRSRPPCRTPAGSAWWASGAGPRSSSPRCSTSDRGVGSPRSLRGAPVASTGADTELSEAFWVGWPDAHHRVLTSAVEASGDGDDVVGHMPGPDGTTRKVPRFFVSPPTRDVTGNIDAMALYAGTAIDAITGRASAGEVVEELLGAIA